MKIALTKTGPNIFTPATQQDAEMLEHVGFGEVVHGNFTKMRNGKFHRKLFALLKIGFDSWEPPETEYKGHPAQKNFDRFRHDVIVAAGFYDIVISITGEARAEAKSISYGNMDDLEFSELYSSVINVMLQRVLKNYTREDLEKVVNDILTFS